jgi:hypothetical protein
VKVTHKTHLRSTALLPQRDRLFVKKRRNWKARQLVTAIMVVPSSPSLSSKYYVQQREQEHDNLATIVDESSDKDPLLINETTNVLRLLDDFLLQYNTTDTVDKVGADSVQDGITDASTKIISNEYAHDIAQHSQDTSTSVSAFEQNQFTESSIDNTEQQLNNTEHNVSNIVPNLSTVSIKVLDSVDATTDRETVDAVVVESTIAATNQMGNEQGKYQDQGHVVIDEIIEITSVDPILTQQNDANNVLNEITVKHQPSSEEIHISDKEPANQSEMLLLRELNNHQGVVVNDVESDSNKKEGMMDDLTCNVFQASSFSQMDFDFSTGMNKLLQSIKAMRFPKIDNLDIKSYVSTDESNQETRSMNLNINTVAEAERSINVDQQQENVAEPEVLSKDDIELSCEDEVGANLDDKSVVSSVIIINSNQKSREVVTLLDDDVKLDHPPVLRRILTPNTSIAVPTSPTTTGSTHGNDTNILTALARKMSLLRSSASPKQHNHDNELIETPIISQTNEIENPIDSNINPDRIIEARSTTITETKSTVASVIHCDDHSTTGSSVTDNISVTPSKVSTNGFHFDPTLIDNTPSEDNITTLQNPSISNNNDEPSSYTEPVVIERTLVNVTNEIEQEVIERTRTVENVANEIEQELPQEEAIAHVPFAIAEEELAVKSSSDAASSENRSVKMIKSTSFTSRAGSLLQMIGSRSNHERSTRSLTKKPTGSHLSNSSRVSFNEETQRIATMLTTTSSSDKHHHAKGNSIESLASVGINSIERNKINKSRSAPGSASGSSEFDNAIDPNGETTSTFASCSAEKNEVEIIETNQIDVNYAREVPLPSSTSYQSIYSKATATFVQDDEAKMVVSNKSHDDSVLPLVSVASNKSLLSRYSTKSASKAQKSAIIPIAKTNEDNIIQSSGSRHEGMNQISSVSSVTSNNSAFQERSTCDIAATFSNVVTPSVVESNSEMMNNGQEVMMEGGDQPVQHGVLVASPSNKSFSSRYSTKPSSLMVENITVDKQLDRVTDTNTKETVEDIPMVRTFSNKSLLSRASQVEVKSVVSPKTIIKDEIPVVRTLSNKSLLSRASAKSIRSAISRRLASSATATSNRSGHKVEAVDEQRDDHYTAVEVDKIQSPTSPSVASVGSKAIQSISNDSTKAVSIAQSTARSGTMNVVEYNDETERIYQEELPEDQFEQVCSPEVVEEEVVVAPEAMLYLNTSHSLISAMSTNTMGTYATKKSTGTSKTPTHTESEDQRSRSRSINNNIIKKNSTHRSVQTKSSSMSGSTTTPRTVNLMEF